jgi:hypothetical protein
MGGGGGNLSLGPLQKASAYCFYYHLAECIFICNVYIYICQHDTLYVSKKLIKVYVYCSLNAQTKIKPLSKFIA